MTGLDHVLDRTVTIAAGGRETVFRYFTDSEPSPSATPTPAPTGSTT